MKNIYLISTSKPSELKLSKKGILQFLGSNSSKNPNNHFKGIFQNIYIISDVEIKVGDYRYSLLQNNFELVSKFSLKVNKEYWKLNNQIHKKIILTTDQDLIADGIQSIDDEFLEWFLNNPNCEEVEVIPLRKSSGYYDEKEVWHWDFLAYKIIIPKEPKITNCSNKNCQSGVINGINPKICKKCNPKEAPKQGYVKSETEFLGIEFILKYGSKQFVPNLKEEPKQPLQKLVDKGYADNVILNEDMTWELQLNQQCKDCDKSLDNCICTEDTVDLKQETLEEFALEQSLKIYGDYDTEGIQSNARAFIKIGAKWQQERSYSEEEVLNLLEKRTDNVFRTSVSFTDTKEWFEKFKKK